MRRCVTRASGLAIVTQAAASASMSACRARASLHARFVTRASAYTSKQGQDLTLAHAKCVTTASTQISKQGQHATVTQILAPC